ncbi:hypothetical protein N8766_05280 [bacterium]|nr:hypothetical protein [bacterium]MDB4746079.1 hypothetical protein [Verrucomicrobiota bacterium]
MIGLPSQRHYVCNPAAYEAISRDEWRRNEEALRAEMARGDSLPTGKQTTGLTGWAEVNIETHWQ